VRLDFFHRVIRNLLEENLEQFVSSRVLNLWPRYWNHLGDVLSAVGVIAFTLASLLIVDLGLNWHELTTRRD
jgi:hypothetical protein